jgi:hypothetical protein
MTRKFAFTVILGLSVYSVCCCRADSQSSTVSFPGVVYRNSAGVSKPVPGCQTFLYNPSSGWIGPSITDAYGRFAFYNVPRGEYVLRIFDGSGHQIWNEAVVVPTPAVHTVVLS